jgi:hypothetical protein
MVQRSKNLDGMSPLDPNDKAEVEDSRMSHNTRDRDDTYGDRGGFNSREMSNRDWENANAPTDPASRRAFRERYAQTHLPNLPHKDGWHRFWATTSHATNTPSRLLSLGYRYLTMQQLEAEGAQWHPEQASTKDASTNDGQVRWREMIGMECPEALYQQYMREFHHDLPRDMARDIFDPLQDLGERVAGRGNVNFTEDFKEVQRFRRPPKQFE